MNLNQRLAGREKDFNPQLGLYGAALKSNGYHTQVADGTWVHKTNPNLTYAHELLGLDEPHLVLRAQTMIRHLISLQDQNPLSSTYGIWPYLVEETLEQMSPPDWNWADFLGFKLARILHDYGAQLPDDLRALMKESLGHAARSVFRRNIHLGYTNIAVKGGCVSVAAGEINAENWLVDYGKRRLRAVVEHFQYHGGFNEYNSPAYTKLVLDICETALLILRDEAARADIEQIRQFAWQTVATHFHPATKQLVGPQSRAYSNFLPANWLDFLGVRTGLWNSNRETEAAPPCPMELIERFRALPDSPLETRHPYIRRDNTRSTIGTTWLSDEACLGSISHDICWTQRRSLLGYWPGEHDKPVALRIRILRDGQDFASGFVWNAQSGPRILTVSSFITGGGDFHCHLDRPTDGVFSMRELKVCYELQGEKVGARELENGKFELSAGRFRAVVHTAPSRFEGQEIHWNLKTENDRVCVEGVCVLPAERLDISLLSEVVIASAVEIISLGQAPNSASISVARHADGTFIARWPLESATLSIRAPLVPVPESETHGYGATPIES